LLYFVFIKFYLILKIENEEHLTEEQEDKLDEIKYKMKEELLPEIEKLDKNNPKFYKN